MKDLQFEIHDGMLCVKSDAESGLIRLTTRLYNGKTATLDFLTLIQPKGLFGLVDMQVQEPVAIEGEPSCA